MWIALSESSKFRSISDYISRIDPNNVLNISEEEYGKIIKKMKNDSTWNEYLDYFKQIRSLNYKKYETALEIIEKNNIEMLPINSNQYPIALLKIKSPPLVLFKKGTLQNFSNCIAIVGRRDCSHYAHYIARELSRELAKKKFTIVAGLARGVDIEAHCGSLDVNGKTIAVLAKPLHKIYPAEFREVSNDIANNGALLSEKASEVIFGQQDFINRNRIISGISKAVIIIETFKEGGSIHQLKFAINQKCPAFILKPKKENSNQYQGFKKAISLGAISFSSVDEIVKIIKNIEADEISTLETKIVKKEEKQLNLMEYINKSN